MKKTILSASILLSSLTMQAQDITLPAPDMNQASKNVVETLKQRHSVRSFSDQKLTNEQLSNLCWAACGISWDENHITSPTAMNRQEVRLFVFNDTGVYEYLPKQNLLRQKATGDHRALIAGTPQRSQDFVKDAPVSLLMVGDLEKFGGDNEHARMMVAVDCGIVTQNIDLYCEAVGLATVPRGTMDGDAIKQLLGLGDKHLVLMNNPVGYAK